MIHRAARRSIGYADAAVLHPRGLPFLLAVPSSLPPCSDETCHPTRHIAYDPERPGRQMAGMLRHLRATPGQDYFEMKTVPRAFWIQGVARRERNMKLTWGRIARADLKYYLPGETYILKLIHSVWRRTNFTRKCLSVLHAELHEA